MGFVAELFYAGGELSITRARQLDVRPFST